MAKQRKRFTYKKMVIASISVLSVLLFVLAFGVIGIYASQTQTVLNNVTVDYISTQVDGELRIRAYYKEVGDAEASWHVLTTASTGYPSNSGVVRLRAKEGDRNETINSLNLNLNSSATFVVFECAFKNLGSAAVKMKFDEGLNDLSSNPVAINVEQSQRISKSIISSNFETINDSPLNYSALAVSGRRNTDTYIEDYVYYYFKVEASDLAHSARYATCHTWTLTGNETEVDVTVINDGGTGLTTIKGIRGACPPILKTSNLPAKSNLYNFYGYYSSATNDEQYYRSSGEPTRALPLGTDPLSLYAQYSIEAYVDLTTHEASWPSGVNTSTQVRVIIPNTATSVKSSGFSYCSGLIGVDIPNTIIEIKSNAFYSCTGLTSIEIPEGVTSIKHRAFWACTGLTSITIPNSVTSIGGDICNNCNNLEFNIYDNAKYLGNTNNPYLILYKGTSSSITSVVIHDETRFICYRAFFGYSSLDTVVFEGEDLIEIGTEAFYQCPITSINIPNSVMSVGWQAFTNSSGFITHEGIKYLGNSTNPYLILYEVVNKAITNFTFPNGTKIIYGQSFKGCTNLLSINIPERITDIGGYAFSNCNRLTSITIPDSVTSIGGYAFSGCSGLTSITIPDGVTNIEPAAFYGCTGLTQVTIDSGDISSALTDYYECGYLVCYANVVYIKNGLSVGSYVTSNFTCSEEPVDGYWIYTKNS